MPSTLTRRPQATAFSIEDLLDRVRRGEVRIPEFQRPLKWTAEDVRDLFDSVYRGYPIGTLLFWKREAPAASVSFGPVRIDAPSSSQALWVVDGQQRITALTGVLLHPADAAPDGFALFYDLETEEVVSQANGESPPHWLPLRVVLDSELLLEWLDRYPGRAQNPEHTRRAIRIGKAIREYQVPAYVVEDAEEKSLRIIFKRLNTAGNPLSQTEVFNALYGGTAGSRPTSLQGLAEDLRALGFGTLTESMMLRAVLAVRGLDFTQDFQGQLREEDDLTETLQATQRALQSTIVFLKRDAGIPHLLLLPEDISFYLLARFFHLHPEPSPRSRELLARWLWRRATASVSNLLIPQGAALSFDASDEERTVQELLAQVPARPGPLEQQLPSFRFFALDTVMGVVDANALLSLHPRHLLTGAPLDVAAMLEEAGRSAFHPILPNTLTLQPQQTASMPLVQLTVANYLFHPPQPDTDAGGALQTEHTPGPETLASHALTLEGIRLLQENQHRDFLLMRLDALNAVTVSFLKARTRWDESDRPSLQSLIVDDEED
ncbi:DUF262 domain-containing protein [Pyxidicoccus sp. MSG2]|uniref:DUF262 domain-containing protein n=1 Tax=Pyxidicoccus sp. MSG2 TaxID=2996790 RepID=UPI00226E97D5|nr:DUF262 domain-containing protein [Pyxidicoccus sp. MSG2]MCY1018071.1 DUF262 domain-containing protein [Pyxidicoccus sp. MSG2]